MKQLVLRTAKTAGLFALSRALFHSRLRILCYHGVWTGADPHYGDCLFMRAETFARRMDWLARSGCVVLPLAEALQRLREGNLPPWSAAITIDDAWYGTYSHMLPVLEYHHLPATVYVTTFYPSKDAPVLNIMVHACVERCSDLGEAWRRLAGAVPEFAQTPMPDRSTMAARMVQYVEAGDCFADKQRRAWAVVDAVGADRSQIEASRCFHMMRPNELADARRRGFDLQPHTHRHKMYGFDPTLLAEDLDLNRQLIAAFAGVPIDQQQHFCYPSGTHDRAAFDALQASGMVSATTTHFGLASAASPALALPRILDCECASDLEFEAKMSGLWSLSSMLRPRQ